MRRQDALTYILGYDQKQDLILAVYYFQVAINHYLALHSLFETSVAERHKRKSLV
jgi:glycerol-3-phosphate O-acyltransferase